MHVKTQANIRHFIDIVYTPATSVIKVKACNLFEICQKNAS